MSSGGTQGYTGQAPEGLDDCDYFSRKQRLLAVLFRSVVTGPVALEAARTHLGCDVLAACTGVARVKTSNTHSPLKASAPTVKGGSCRCTEATGYRTAQKSRAVPRSGGARRQNADEDPKDKNGLTRLHAAECRGTATVPSPNGSVGLQSGNDGGRKRKLYDEELPVGVYFHQQKYVANWVDPKTRRQIKVCFPIDVWGDAPARSMAVIARRQRCTDVSEVEGLFKIAKGDRSTSPHRSLPKENVMHASSSSANSPLAPSLEEAVHLDNQETRVQRLVANSA
ncbi:AP2 domain transcription factor AP2XII-6 [Besnoitia besnoiti]|uniref:AP2 domain transcription factor AP2XII-6 n=1 Tax=Besnoitia besnoiti TaxID=94643 RepID=A0A2A9MQ75_BESBE|nr:AP2 domain transcription factor AP2XII-6 [Besnoitia besnoiti]PFH38102.1 AP2 domain transcription factor AP2XII-6 [Besnoitia besnoiti]